MNISNIGKYIKTQSLNICNIFEHKLNNYLIILTAYHIIMISY